MSAPDGGALLTISHVSKVFHAGAFGSAELCAVDDVTFSLHRGEVIALVGESGSGKTTIGRMVLALSRPSSGSIVFDGVDVARLRGASLKDYYRRAQGVFQDPFSSYNPIFKVDRIFSMLQHEFAATMAPNEWAGKVTAALAAVGLRPDEVLRKYPHQLSGGQLQRLLIARAVLLDIDLLVADEIISMLDASTRIDVLNLLGALKERGLAIIFVTHDLALGSYIADTTVILKGGRIVEMGPTTAVFADPQHSYTKALLASVPRLHQRWSPAAVPAMGSDDAQPPAAR